MADQFDFSAIGKRLDEFLDQKHPTYLMLGESHTTAQDNLRMLNAPEVQAVLQKHGFYDIALEARHELQGMADKVANGKKTPADLAEEAVKMYKKAGDKEAEDARDTYKLRGELVASSHNRGFTVHFAETQGNVKQYVALFNRLQDESAHIAEIVRFSQNTDIDGKHWPDKINEILDRYPDYKTNPVSENARSHDLFKLQNEIMKDMKNKIVNWDEGGMESRSKNDGKLANYIESRTDGRKTVILYGAEHGREPNDLDEKLQAKGATTARLTLTSNDTQLIFIAQDFDVLGKQNPDAYLQMSKALLIDGEKAADYGAIKRDAAAAPKLDAPTPR